MKISCFSILKKDNAILRKEILLTLLKAKLEKETNKITAKFLKSMIEYEELEKK